MFSCSALFKFHLWWINETFFCFVLFFSASWSHLILFIYFLRIKLVVHSCVCDVYGVTDVCDVWEQEVQWKPPDPPPTAHKQVTAVSLKHLKLRPPPPPQTSALSSSVGQEQKSGSAPTQKNEASCFWAEELEATFPTDAALRKPTVFEHILKPESRLFVSPLQGQQLQFTLRHSLRQTSLSLKLWGNINKNNDTNINNNINRNFHSALLFVTFILKCFLMRLKGKFNVSDASLRNKTLDQNDLFCFIMQKKFTDVCKVKMCYVTWHYAMLCYVMLSYVTLR